MAKLGLIVRMAGIEQTPVDDLFVRNALFLHGGNALFPLLNYLNCLVKGLTTSRFTVYQTAVAGEECLCAEIA